jgi:molybdenum cofactor guanylyltransferase
MLNPTQLTALILAGGQARRMGGIDKGLLELNGRAMISHVVSAIQPHVQQVLISANRNQDQYEALTGCTVLSDQAGLSEFAGRFEGPLAGMLAGLTVAETDYMLCLPCDSPLITADLIQRLSDSLSREQADLSVASDGERLQPVFALLNRQLHPSLLAFLQQGGRKIDRWYAQHRMAIADCTDLRALFLNINTPEDRHALAQQLNQ